MTDATRPCAPGGTDSEGEESRNLLIPTESDLWGGSAPAWMPADDHEPFSPDQLAAIARYESDLSIQLVAKPRRFRHSLSVGRTAERLACRYGVDPYLARVSGILHDWSKGLSNSEVIDHARDLGIDLGVGYDLVQPLLHGMVAARELPARYPELPQAVWQAIDRHTLGNADMSPLDMVLFVADGIEPLRGSIPVLDKQRSHVATSSLADLFWEIFADGVAYVVSTRRYLYPGTLGIYNDIVLLRKAGAERKPA